MVLAKSVGAHMLLPQALDDGHEATGFCVCCATFHSCFGSVLLFSCCFLLEWECLFYHYILEECNFLIFIGITAKSISWVSRVKVVLHGFCFMR